MARPRPAPASRLPAPAQAPPPPVPRAPPRPTPDKGLPCIPRPDGDYLPAGLRCRTGVVAPGPPPPRRAVRASIVAQWQRAVHGLAGGRWTLPGPGAAGRGPAATPRRHRARFRVSGPGRPYAGHTEEQAEELLLPVPLLSRETTAGRTARAEISSPGREVAFLGARVGRVRQAAGVGGRRRYRESEDSPPPWCRPEPGAPRPARACCHRRQHRV